MGLKKKLKRKKRAEQAALQEKMQKDVEQCQKEIVPILQKYDLVFQPIIRYYPTGSIAELIFVRPPEKKQAGPPPGQLPAQPAPEKK